MLVCSSLTDELTTYYRQCTADGRRPCGQKCRAPRLSRGAGGLGLVQNGAPEGRKIRKKSVAPPGFILKLARNPRGLRGCCPMVLLERDIPRLSKAGMPSRSEAGA